MYKFLTTFIFSAVLLASDIAVIKKIRGDVFIKRNERNIIANLELRLKNEDIIITKKDSSIGIIFEDATILTLGENSILKIDEYLFKPLKNEFKFKLNLTKGSAGFESGKIGKLAPESVEFKIPEGIIGIRGTKFFVKVNK